MIELRLRKPVLYYPPGIDAFIATAVGVPPFRLPARTTLRLIDFARKGDQHGIVVLTPDRVRLWIPRQVVRDYAYVPRGS